MGRYWIVRYIPSEVDPWLTTDEWLVRQYGSMYRVEEITREEFDIYRMSGYEEFPGRAWFQK